MKKTKIVCTIGPASEKKEILTKMIQAGMNVARLNFSHGNHQEHKARIDTIKEIREELGRHVAIVLDTKGPEIRTGKFDEEEVLIEQGSQFILTPRDVIGNKNLCSISYKHLAEDVKVGGKVLIDDGLIELEVTEIQDGEVICVAINSGIVKNNKGINVPSVKIQLPAITQRDKDDILFGIANGIDFIAASFVRKMEDVLEIRKILEENDGKGIKIISKIENEEGVENLDEIIAVSDGIMVARGDLGVEIPAKKIPLLQKQMIKACNIEGKPVITATQMLDSMIRNPRPTRAEVTDVANAIFDGTDAVMLSGETAAGKYPVEAVETMCDIALTTEEALDYKMILATKNSYKSKSITNAISHATCTTAQDLNATAIITATAAGYTAQMISKFRPKAPIIASTTTEATARRLALTWGVYPIIINENDDGDRIFDASIRESKNKGLINEGDLAIFTAGVPYGKSGTTNMMKVYIASNMLVKGTGVVRKAATGRACLIKGEGEAQSKVQEGDIVVAYYLDEAMLRIVEEKAAGFIVEEEGAYSGTAAAGRSLNKATVVGAEKAMRLITDGMAVTIDGYRGIVYEGNASGLWMETD